VISVKQEDDFDTNGQWKIKVKNCETDEEQDLIYDAVMICTGHHTDKNMPEFPGMKDFKGKILHSHAYRHTAGYEGKRVVVIGIGNSGGDAAVELSRVTAQVIIKMFYFDRTLWKIFQKRVVRIELYVYTYI